MFLESINENLLEKTSTFSVHFVLVSFSLLSSRSISRFVSPSFHPKSSRCKVHRDDFHGGGQKSDQAKWRWRGGRAEGKMREVVDVCHDVHDMCIGKHAPYSPLPKTEPQKAPPALLHLHKPRTEFSFWARALVLFRNVRSDTRNT